MKVDIAIITIRDDEFDAVFNRLEKHAFETIAGSSERTYAIFSVPTRDKKICKVALARSPEQGTDVSQQVASDMMRDLDPQLLLVVGIAGGVPNNEFTLGDVIISSRIHNFNLNAIKQGEATTFNVMGGIHPRVSNITASLPMYRSRLAGWNQSESINHQRPTLDVPWAESHLYGDSEWRNDVIASLRTQFGESATRDQLPLFKIGTIASSNSLIKDTEIPTTWLKSARSILAVEMESAGVLQAAQQMNQQYPVMAIRGISDIIGLKRDTSWTPYACQTAGAFTYAFIQAGIIAPRANTSSTTTTSSTPSAPIAQTKPNGANQTSSADPTQPVPFNLFISYSAKDETFKEELETHLTTLRREGTIRPWSSGQTQAGGEKEQDMKTHIDEAQIILLLISPSFLASEKQYDEEMMRAMERHASGAARVIPILLRPADIGKSPFNKLQALPRSQQTVDKANNRDEAWVQIVREIRDVCNSLRESQKQS